MSDRAALKPQTPLVARVDGVSTSEAIRAAIAEHIEKRRRDPAFQSRLQRIRDEERVVLERLTRLE